MTDVTELLAGLEGHAPEPIIEPDDRLVPLALEHVPQPVFWLQRDGRIAGANAALLQLFGDISRQVLIGRRLADLFADGSRYDDAHQAVMAGDEAVIEERFSGNFVDGVRMHLSAKLLQLRDADGTVVGLASVVTDHTEMTMLETELAQAHELESVGQLAAGIAHEINTPMQYIGDNTHFLKATITRLLTIADAAQTAIADNATDTDRDHLATVLANAKLPLLAERAPKAAADALDGVDNVSRIVQAMKRFSHPGSDNHEPVDINDAITTTTTVCRNEWKYQAHLDLQLADDLPLIEGRLGPLNQVWLNMIVNAAHAIADNHPDGQLGTITITTSHATLEPDDDHVTITIADNGAGIAQDHLTKVFDHFFTTKDVGKGTGQGLAIAHQVIATEHHGTLTVDSTIGHGTTFTITLPTTQPTEDGVTP